MITFGPLDRQTGEAWVDMTYPAFRSVLQRPPCDRSFVAIAAREAHERVALGLARYDGRCVAEILSIFVANAWRRRGVAASLVERLEAASRQLGASRIEVAYSSAAASVPAIESLLRRSSFSPPQARMLIATADARMLEAPWMQRLPPPGRLALFEWADLTPAEREALVAKGQENPEAFGGLPLAAPDLFEPINSIGLREGERVVGWLLTHRVAPRTIRYTHLYVQPEHRASGQALSLLSEGIRRQAAALGEGSNAVFGVWVQNTRMVRFTRRRLAPYLVSLNETRGACKDLL